MQIGVGRIAQSVQRLHTGWTVRGSNPGGARFSAPVQTGLEAHPASCTMGTGFFPGVRCCPGVTLTPHPLLVQRSKLEQSYTSTLPKGFRGLWKGETYLGRLDSHRIRPVDYIRHGSDANTVKLILHYDQNYKR